MSLLQRNEGTKLDFKLQLSLKTDSEKKELSKDVTAIANSNGGRGYIIFGVEDKTKKIVGIEDKKYSEEQIQQIISQRCDPPVSVRFDIIAVESQNVGVLTIYRSNQRPHQVRQTGTFYIRRGSTTDIARREEIASMMQETGLLEYERIILHKAPVSELDEALINEYIFKTGLNSQAEDYYALLEGIGIVGAEEDASKYHPTVGGLLAFGHHPQQFLPHTGIRVINHGNNKEVRQFKGPIIRMLDEIESYLTQIIPDPAYPISAVVDAVANAAVHRDYLSYGREIVLFIGRSKIEISNPGAVYGEDDIQDLFRGRNPYRRNQWLYQRLLILDNKKRFLKSGAGVRRIQKEFKTLGGAKFINDIKKNLFKVILPAFSNPSNQ